MLQYMETEQESHKSAHENAGPRLPPGTHLVPLSCPLGVGFSQMLSTTSRERVLKYMSGPATVSQSASHRAKVVS